MAHDPVPAPRHWRVENRVYAVRRFNAAAIRELENFVRDSVPDPRRELARALEGLPPETVKAVWEAEAPRLPLWPPPFGSPQSIDALTTTEGMTLLVYHACRREHPEMTRERARELVERLEDAETDDDAMADLIRLVLGRDREPDEADGGTEESATPTQGSPAATPMPAGEPTNPPEPTSA